MEEKETMILNYVGTGEFDMPAYQDENGHYWVNINLMLSNPNGLHSTTNNEIDGEPDRPFLETYPNETVEFIGEPDPRERMYQGDYRMLSRLQSDVKYYLGAGNRYAGHLYYEDPKKHIEEMRNLYDKFPEDLKPQWCTAEMLDEYEAQMVNNCDKAS